MKKRVFLFPTAVFPDIDSLENSEVFQYLGDDVDSIYNDLWKEVKSTSIATVHNFDPSIPTVCAPNEQPVRITVTIQYLHSYE